MQEEQQQRRDAVLQSIVGGASRTHLKSVPQSYWWQSLFSNEPSDEELLGAQTDQKRSVEVMSEFIKITTVQSSGFATLESLRKFLITLFDHQLKRENKVCDFVIFPENGIGEDVRDNLETNKCWDGLKELAKEYNVYLVLGTVCEFAGRDLYVTCVTIDNKGEIACAYQKRKPTIEGAHMKGTKVGIWETEFGTASTMICFDVENADIRNETLEYNPYLLFNPTLIPDNASMRKYPDIYYGGWRTALDSVSDKFESICSTHGVNIIRCDIAHPAKGSSQTIGTYKTDTTPTNKIEIFDVYLDGPKIRESNHFPSLTSEPTRHRTAAKDNVGSRYDTRFFTTSSFLGTCDAQPLSMTQIIAGGKDGKMYVHHRRNQNLISSHSLNSPICCMERWCPSSTNWLVGTESGINLWDVNAGIPVQFYSSDSPVLHIARPFSQPSTDDGTEDPPQFLYATCNSLYVFPVNDSSDPPKPVLVTDQLEKDYGNGNRIQGLQQGATENQIIIGIGNSIQIRDLKNIDSPISIVEFESPVTDIKLFMSPSGDEEVWASGGNRVTKMRGTDLGVVGWYEASPSLITSVAVLNSNDFLCSSTDTLIRACRLLDSPGQGETLYKFAGHSRAVWKVNKINDYEFTSCGAEKCYKLWRFHQNREKQVPLSCLFK